MINVTNETPMIQTRNGKEYFVGYGAVFFDRKTPGTEYQLAENVYERFLPSAFNLRQERPIELWYNHNSDFCLGTKETGLELRVDGKGLSYEQEINPDDVDHQKVKSKIENGIIKGSSIGFWVTRASQIKEGDREIFLIKECEVRDLGPVNVPAYKAASAFCRNASKNESPLMTRIQQENEKDLDFLRRLVKTHDRIDRYTLN
ncbi:MAG: HK97 family phage prohead protease [Planctomycetaceae bacterium]|nr:HK97 family phage prohead protease [Planctomycetaceae bacterium]